MRGIIIKYCLRLLPLNRTGVITTNRNLKDQNLRLFNITVSVSDHGTPPLTASQQARVAILVFTPLQSPFILIDDTDTSITIRFDLKNTASSNIAQYGVIVQEYLEDESDREYPDHGARRNPPSALP